MRWKINRLADNTNIHTNIQINVLVCVCVWTASRRVLLAHAHALTLTYIYKDSDFGAKTDSSLHSCSRPRALHLHRVPRAASLLLSAHCIDADGDVNVNVGSTKSQRPPRLPPATNVLRTHTISLTHTQSHLHTHTRAELCWCCWARVEEFTRALSSFPFPFVCSWHTHTTKQQD